MWRPIADDVTFEEIVDPDVDAPAAIARTVLENPDAMVCMTTHGRGRLRWAAAGSVAEEVIRDSSSPLLLVGPRGEPTLDRVAHRVVVCVDGSESGRVATRHACEWAKALDLDVHLVFATHPLDVEDSEHPDVVFGPYEDIVRARACPCAAISSSGARSSGAHSPTSRKIPAATLMVMAAHRHGPVARAVLGSTTMAVLNVTSCPVLVVPPGEH